MWVSQHVTNHEVNVCAAAQVLVVSDCPLECGACTPEAAGCDTTNSDVDMLVKRYEDVAPDKLVAHSLARHAAPIVGGVVAIAGFVMVVTAFSRYRQAGETAYRDVLIIEEEPINHA